MCFELGGVFVRSPPDCIAAASGETSEIVRTKRGEKWIYG